MLTYPKERKNNDFHMTLCTYIIYYDAINVFLCETQTKDHTWCHANRVIARLRSCCSRGFHLLQQSRVSLPYGSEVSITMNTVATLQHMSKNQNTHLSTQIGCVDQSIYCTKIHLGPNSTDGTINLLKKWQHTTTNITLEKTQTRCHFDAILPNTMDLFVRLNRWVYVTSWWWFEHDRRPRFATGKLTIRKPKPKVPRDCHQKLQCFLWNPTWKHEETKMKKKCLPKNHTTHNEWLQTHQYKLCKI